MSTLTMTTNQTPSSTTTTATEYLQSVESLKQQREFLSLQAYSDQIKLLANNQAAELPAESFSQLLIALGKDSSDVQRDIRRCQAIAKFNIDQANLVSLTDELDDVQDALVEAVEKLEEIALPMEQRVDYLRNQAGAIDNAIVKIRARSKPAPDLIPPEYLNLIPTDRHAEASRASGKAGQAIMILTEKVESLSTLEVEKSEEPIRLRDLQRAQAGLKIWQGVMDNINQWTAVIAAGKQRLDESIDPLTGLWAPADQPEAYAVHVPSDAFMVPSAENVAALTDQKGGAS